MKDQGEKYGYMPVVPLPFVNRLPQDTTCECGEMILLDDTVAYYDDALLHAKCANEQWELDN